MYDQYGLDGLTGGSGGPGFSPEDLFEHLFNGASFGGFGGAGRRKRRGDDSTIPYEVTLQDLYQGKTVKMQIEKTVVCGTCSGSVNVQNPVHPLTRSNVDRGARAGQSQNSVRDVKEKV
jgi:DnaJ homolog subfamily A member 2